MAENIELENTDLGSGSEGADAGIKGGAEAGADEGADIGKKEDGAEAGADAGKKDVGADNNEIYGAPETYDYKDVNINKY